ncbi:MAG: glyoxylate/hydroxypyruvate reductase A [Betaproteobacteria bacterium]|nr:MAG: glyoxylate/hydroxypyruvate reductase A [Betaproteobacteria bacterium]
MNKEPVSIVVQSTGIDVVPAIIQALKRLKPDWHYGAWPCEIRADYAIVWKPPGELFDRNPLLKAAINYGAGVDAILSMASVPAHIPIIRLEDAGMAQQMAEYALYGVIHHHRHMQIYCAQQRDRIWLQHEDRANLQRPVVGVMGLGEMGGHVAAKIAAFGYEVRGWSKSKRAVEGVQCFAGSEQFSEFLSATHVLVCMLPLTESTRGIVNAKTLASLPHGSFLINAGRGDHMIEADVLAALQSGQLAGALLDVFATEPLPQHNALWSHPNVIVTPHIAATTPIRDACAQIVDKIERLERGELVSGIVNRNVGY